MFFAAGVGAYGAAMFHLFTHAFFKALLFLGSGAVIHGMHHEQDIKKMGAVKTLMPFTYALMVIGTIAITGVGIPGFHPGGLAIGAAGFVSKDAIIESAYEAGIAGKPFAYYAFAMGVIAAVFTAFYSWRLIFITFHGASRAPEAVRKHPHEIPRLMHWSLVPLAIGALFAGMAFAKNFIGKDSASFWNGALYSAADHQSAEAEHGVASERAAPDEHAVAEEAHGGEGGHPLPGWVIFSPFLAMVIGLVAAMRQYLNADPLRPGLLRPGGMIYAFLKNKWYFDEFYDFVFVKPAFAIGRFLWLYGDGKTIDGVGPDGVASTVVAGARRIVKVQSGYIYHYAFAMLIGIAALVTLIVVRAGGGQ